LIGYLAYRSGLMAKVFGILLVVEGYRALGAGLRRGMGETRPMVGMSTS
jgi:hypothetical protein